VLLAASTGGRIVNSQYTGVSGSYVDERTGRTIYIDGSHTHEGVGGDFRIRDGLLTGAKHYQ
jgi:hypothetical protein